MKPAFDLRALRWRQDGRFIPSRRGRRKSDRLGRGIELAAIGNVIASVDGWTVVSVDGAHFYHTTTTECNCPDAMYRGGPCKHVYAVALRERRLSPLLKADSRGVEIGAAAESRTRGDSHAPLWRKRVTRG